MGCCDSHVFQSENSSDKYFIRPSLSVLSHENQAIYLQPIPNFKAQQDCKSQENQDHDSLYTLRQRLENIFPIFHDQNHASTIKSFGDQLLSPNSININENKSKYQQVHSSFVMGSDTGNESRSKNFFNDTSESQSKSEFAQNNSQIISSASLSSKRQLEKQLFYINSDCVGNIKLLKWTQENRLGLSLKIIKIEELQIKCPLLFSSLMQIQLYEQNHKICLISYKILKKGVGIRLYINGIKRMLSLPNINQIISKNIIQQAHREIHILPQGCLSLYLQLLTGWMPEVIYLSEFQNFQEVFHRLAKNFSLGNLFIGFTTLQAQQNSILQSINPRTKKMVLVDSQLNSRQYSWEQIIRTFPVVNANWNPSIYVFSRKVQAISKLKLKPNCGLIRTKPQLLIRIPPSKSQIEVRVVVNMHKREKQSGIGFKIHLYEYNGMFLSGTENYKPIRTSNSYKNLFLSDIFLFQKSDHPTEYLITIEFLDQCSPKNQDIQITLDFYSYCQINVKLVPQPQFRSNQTIFSQVCLSNAGFGMNSPYFLKNLTYSLRAPLNAIVKLSIKANTTRNMLFEVCILPDKTMSKDITFVSPSQIVKEVVQSQQFEGEGVVQFKTKRENYIVVIVGFTPTEGQLCLNAQIYSFNEAVQSQDANKFQISQIMTDYVFQKEVQFLWSFRNPGPRKRTKNNSRAGFYPIKTFQKFFENPYLDLNLPRGKYQFSIISQEFKNSLKFPSLLEDFDDFTLKILSATPPNLSMGIYKLSEDGSEAQIVLDDYEYVPYGIGFWTTSFKLQGLNRFVFSKMEQSSERGLFRIRKLDNLYLQK